MWLHLCLWLGVVASLPSFDPTKPPLEKTDKKPGGRTSRAARPRENGFRYSGDSTTVPTVRHCSSPSGSVDGRILVEEVFSRDIWMMMIDYMMKLLT